MLDFQECMDEAVEEYLLKEHSIHFAPGTCTKFVKCYPVTNTTLEYYITNTGISYLLDYSNGRWFYNNIRIIDTKNVCLDKMLHQFPLMPASEEIGANMCLHDVIYENDV